MGCPGTSGSVALSDPATLASVRRDIPGLDKGCYLNTGTLGPSPRCVTERFFELYRAWQEAGPGNPEVYHAAFEATEAAKPAIAALFGVTPSELAMVANSTDAINIVARGIGLRPGDEVIISDQEHPAGLFIFLHLRQTVGIRLRIARLDAADRQANVREVARLLSPKTRLVSLSHVSSMTGLCLPAKEIVEAAHAKGVPVLFDGAQSAGQMPVDIRAIGCDFYTVNGHKWLLGPIGTGALFVSKDALTDLVPDRVGGNCEESYTYAEDGELRFRPGAARFEFATRCQPLWQAWPEAIAYLERFGLAEIRRRTLELSDRLRRGLRAVAGLTLVGPDVDGDPGMRTGAVTCRIEGLPGLELYDALRRRFGIISRPVAELEATRFTCAFFNTEEEIDRALAAVRSLAREVAG